MQSRTKGLRELPLGIINLIKASTKPLRHHFHDCKVESHVFYRLCFLSVDVYESRIQLNGLIETE